MLKDIEQVRMFWGAWVQSANLYANYTNLINS